MSDLTSPTPPPALDTALRLGLVLALVVACLWVVAPFLTILIWSALLAVMLWPLHAWLRVRSGLTNARSASLIGVGGVVLLAVPLVLLLGELSRFAETLLGIVRSGGATLPPAPDWAGKLPLFGPKFASWWEAGRDDISAMLGQNGDLLKGIAGRIAGGLASFLTAMLSLAIAALFLAFGDQGAALARDSFVRVTGDKERGTRMLGLTTMTIRGVLQGVVGVAFVQAALIGAGFLVAGVPFAGFLILVAFVMGIAQIPALLLTVPAMVWAWSHLDPGPASLFVGYTLVAGFSDQVLKPMMLGRGIDAPMPVILIGVIGGMIAGGMLGLFVGPVLLAIGYVLFVEWLRAGASAGQ